MSLLVLTGVQVVLTGLFLRFFDWLSGVPITLACLLTEHFTFTYVCVSSFQISLAVTTAQSEITHSVMATVTKVTTREKVSVRQRKEELSPSPQKKRQIVVDSELRKR